MCKCLLSQSCLILATPWTVACQDPLSVGFPRQENWSGLPCPLPGGLLDLRIKPASPALAGWFFTTEPPGKSPVSWYPVQKPFSVLGCHDLFCRVTLQILLYVHCFQFLCKHCLLKLMWAIHFPWGCNVESHLLFLLCHLPHLEHLPQLYPSLLLSVFQGIT